ncbi:MAG: phosphatidate cytidylyltransferase [Pirellulaceae bacterium]
MLKLRLLSATVLICGLVGLLYLDGTAAGSWPGIWLLPLAVIAALLMVYELLDLWTDRPDRPLAWPLYAGVLLTVTLAAVPMLWRLTGQPYPPACPLGHLGWPLIGVSAGVALAFCGEMTRYTQPGRSTGSLALSVLALNYAGLLMSFLVALRIVGQQTWGLAAVVSVIVIVKLSDTGAYFTGRAWGRHKMAAVLSPKKTIEGALGGMVAACLGAVLCYLWLVPQLVPPGLHLGSLIGWLVYGLVLAMAGMFGDLAESLLKRDVGRKDSSHWLPGLGGVLDVLDSILFAGAPAYICWVAGLVGPAAAMGGLN